MKSDFLMALLWAVAAVAFVKAVEIVVSFFQK